jgi:hypothetical protein
VRMGKLAGEALGTAISSARFLIVRDEYDEEGGESCITHGRDLSKPGVTLSHFIIGRPIMAMEGR